MVKIYKIKSYAISVGRGCFNDLIINDLDSISSRHVVIERKIDADELLMLGKNGGYHKDLFLEKGEKINLKIGDEIKLPDVTILWLHDYILIGSSHDIRLKDDSISVGELDFNQDFLRNEVNKTRNGNVYTREFIPSLKQVYSVDSEKIELEAPPAKREDDMPGTLITIGPALTMAIPMIIGFVITFIAGRENGINSRAYMFTGLATALGSSILGAMWASLNLKHRSAEAIRNEKLRCEAYEKYVHNAERKIKEKYLKNRNLLRTMNPPISERFLSSNQNQYIYNGKASDDSLYIRLGTGKQNFNIDIQIPRDKFTVVSDDLVNLPKILKSKYSHFHDVPVSVNLYDSSPLGIICSNEEKLKELLRLIILSVLSAVNPLEIKVLLYFESETLKKLYECLNDILLLPQLYMSNENLLFLTRSDLTIFLENNKEEFSSVKSLNNKRFMVITDNCECVKCVMPIDNTSVIALSNSFMTLPDNCRLIIQREEQFDGIIDISGNCNSRQEIYFDSISDEMWKNYIRELSLLSRYFEMKSFDIPQYVSFLGLNELKNLSPDVVRCSWKSSSVCDGISIPLGIAKDKEVINLNFHEKFHGPHGLIAGMTGSGKSEVLQTIIMGLALRYHPNEVGFFLIDYKGGGMASMFEGLPHTFGSISNLSGNIIRRAMISIRSENERRQQKFIEKSVNNIYEYQRLLDSNQADEPLPHIFIIIDEFAELKREEPDFMKELISVARVGRSLGVHLILATQKPSGTVNEDILSNLKFFICLRLQDKMDSNSLLHRNDAAEITNPGRAFLRVGNDEVYKELQCAYTMAPYLENSEEEKSIIFLDRRGKEIDSKQNIKNIGTISELKACLTTVIEAGKMEKTSNVGKLWCDPLENIITYNDSEYIVQKSMITDYNDRFDIVNDIPIGIYDDPRRQTKGLVSYNIMNDGHIFIPGFIKSGKSTLLITISLALIKQYTPKEINFYIIDCNSLKLMPFRNSNMCGGYFYDENEKDIRKLFIMLSEIMNERKKKLEGIGFNKYCNNHDDMPVVILIIDGFGSFRERTSGEYDKDILNILKNGETYGVLTYITALSISTNELPGRMFEHFKTVYPLSLSDKYKYSECLRVSSEKVIDVENLPGRGLVKVRGDILEYQAFLPISKDDEYEIREHIGEITDANNLASNYYATKVPVIPDNPSVVHMMNYADSKNNSNSKNTSLYEIPVGYDVTSGKIYSIPLEKNKQIIISGRERSGKSELLNVINRMAEYIGLSVEHESASEMAIRIDKENLNVSVTIIDEGVLMNSSFQGDVLRKNLYVIHMGGGIDRCPVGDFSYIPYTKQCESKPYMNGTVMKTEENRFYGDVLFVKNGELSDTC